MPSVSYGTLEPTGDVVRYDDTLVIYPEDDVITMLGPIFTPRIHSRYMDTLELASSGKVALTLSDQHALDIQLDQALRRVDFLARDGNSIRLASASNVSVEASSALAIECGAAGASNAIAMGPLGIDMSTAQSASISAVDTVQLSAASGGTTLALGPSGLVAESDSAVVLGSAETLSVTCDGGSSGGAGVASELSMDASGVSVGTGLGGQIRMDVGGTNVARAYYDSGSSRFKFDFAGSISTASGFDTDQVTSRKITLGASDGVRIEDGLANTGAGISVNGAPASIKDNTQYFEKSLLWKTPVVAQGANAMANLGSDGGFSSESFWDLRGGAFRMTHVNQSSGDEVSFQFRINDKDELEIVKRIGRAGGGPEQFEVVTRLGQKRADVKAGVSMSNNKGSFKFSDITAVLPNVSAIASTFNAYKAYDAYFAVVLPTQSVTVADLIALGDALDPSVVKVSGLAPNAYRNTAVTIAGVLGGGALLPNSIHYIVAAIREEGSGLVSSVLARKPVIVTAAGGLFQSSDPNSGDTLTISTSSAITLPVSSSTARAAVVTVTRAVSDYYMSEAYIDPSLHPDNKTQATLAAWITTNFPALVTMV
jgi:hypothetical protein